MTEQKLTKKELNRSWWLFFKYALTVFGYERLQAPGMTLAQLPIIKKFYKDDEEGKKNVLKRHRVFYNSDMWIGALVPGIVVSMEENIANGKKISSEFIQNIKIGLMGPLAGIGDSIMQGTLFPIILSIAIGLTGESGSIIGPMFALLGLFLVPMAVSYYFFHLGYRLGSEAIDKVMGPKMAKIQEAMSVLGLTVTGAITASYVKLNLALTFTGKGTEINIQSILDSMFPNLLSVGIVMLGYYLMTRKKFTAIKFICLLLIIAIVGVVLGIL